MLHLQQKGLSLRPMERTITGKSGVQTSDGIAQVTLRPYHWTEERFQNSSGEANAFIKLLTQDQAEQIINYMGLNELMKEDDNFYVFFTAGSLIFCFMGIRFLLSYL